MRISRSMRQDVAEEPRPSTVERHAGIGFPRRGLLQPGIPDGTWRYVGVTAAKGAIGAVIAALIWPYVPAFESTLEGPDRQWARGLWMMFALFGVVAVWSAVKAIQGAWLAAR